MRPFRVPWGRLAPAAVLVLLAPAVSWPPLLLVVPLPALLTGRLSGDPRTAGWTWLAAAAVGAAALALGGQPVGMWVTAGILAVFTVLLPWLVGLYLRSTSALERAGWEQARILERESELMAERARMRERSRIAQDLHDAVGHELSLLALGAGALEMAENLPGERRSQAGRLREVAGRAADQLMDAVGVLRADAGAAPLDPAGDGVAALVRRSVEAGMDVSLEREGEFRELPVLVDRALHRVVQEALTNAAKHAPGSAPRVVLTGSSGAVSVRVANTVAAVSRPPDRAPGTGSGLVGLRERVRLVGGELSAGPEGGLWVVSARMPVRGPGSRTFTGQDHREDPGTRRAEGAPPVHARLLGYRRARRRALWAIGVVVGVPALAAVSGYVLMLMLTAHQAATATLAPDVFERLRPGQDRAGAEALLPEGELYLEPAGEGAPPKAREGLECRYYRSSADVFAGGHDRYRLCFGPERLVSAEVLVR
ncbi:two-component sensor histidine kinase [Nocardiopsis terrae]|uniref:histidine kinase n=1 Tax=Nocardiopsis terrae TaxID=372655 RepID=A0ABR9HKH0_9ACTN|nr:histidine kinase [Nocardiopsis terrae]MBE1459513.1 signal transduction histidine kinase [Nocardiopsis terrae]GHC95261.1 two-component sensor histidine kinase [Nocardiopsis terrae]